VVWWRGVVVEALSEINYACGGVQNEGNDEDVAVNVTEIRRRKFSSLHCTKPN
jgi:hypothetical protein